MRMRMRWMAMLALLAAQPAAGQIVRGRVVESHSGYPVAFASVTVVDETGLPNGYAQSDAFGDFSIRLQRPGRFLVRAERAGYEPASTGLGDIDEDGVAYRLLLMRPNDALGLNGRGLGFLPRGFFPGTGATGATDTRPAPARAPAPDAAPPAATGSSGPGSVGSPDRPRPTARPRKGEDGDRVTPRPAARLSPPTGRAGTGRP